ncbi:hypothetical protein V6B05_09510 [Lactococcus garvieae]|uniref:hypothetical protein n=1 Tax=Lactococcus garvieae TaxID=1363 RepID=UPI001F6239BC|nr:hypothetical protein [Lactococcus garvieae]MCI3861379.1 hypothetical protein [Lactococcus garvieae]
MFEEFLEKELQRRVKLLSLLWEKDEVTSIELALEIDVTPATIKSDVKAINLEYAVGVDPLIVSSTTGYSILNKNLRNRGNYLKKIYRSSLFVKATVFFLESNLTSLKMLENKENLSQTKAYSVKSKVEEYFERLKVLENGQVTEKTELRVRFLMAFYQWELGVETISISNTNRKLYQELFKEVEAIERCMFSIRSKEYAMILFQIGFMRRKENKFLLEKTEIDFIKKTIIYKRLSPILNNFLQKMVNFDIREEEIIYFALIFNVMNANYYDDFSETFNSYFLLIKNASFLNYQCLVRTFEVEFNCVLENNKIFEAAIVTFIRKCLFNLQALIPEEHVSIGNVISLPEDFKFKIQEILEVWNTTTGLDLVFSEAHVLQFASKFIFLLRKTERIKHIYLLTSFHTDYLLAKEVLMNEYGALVDIQRFNPLEARKYNPEDLILYDTEYNGIDFISKKLKIKYIFDLKELQNIRTLLFGYDLEGIKESARTKSV